MSIWDKIFNYRPRAIKLDQTYVINLDRTPERYAASKKQLDFYKIDHNRFNAVDGFNIIVVDNAGNKFSGTDIKSKKAHLFFGNEYKIIHGEEKITYCADFDIVHRIITIGELGCYISHLNIYKEIVFKNLKYVLILEDDAELVENFSDNLSNILSNTPRNWDMIFLYLHPMGRRIYKYYNSYLKKISARSYNITGLGGYIISNVGAQKLVKYTKKFNTPIDNLICALIRKKIINAYIASNFLLDSPLADAFNTSTICDMGRIRL